MKTKEKNESVRITTLGIATALIGSMVGPGFSSGNELMQFFGNFGYIGVAGVLVCETLVAVTVIMAMRLAQKMDTPYFDKVVSPMGDGFFSKLLRLFSMVVTLGFMIACIPAMTAVGATVLEQQFGMNFQVAAIVYTCFVAVPVLFGTEGFTKSMSAFIPFVVIAGVVICLCVCMQPQAKAIDFQSLQVTNGLMKNWFLAALLYFSYNTTVGIAVVVPLGQKVKDNRKIIQGGILGAGALAAMICVCVIAIIRNYGNVYQAELPTLVMARKLHPAAGTVYAIMMVICIWAAACGCMYAVLSRAEEWKVQKKSIVNTNWFRVLVMSLVGLAGSHFGFSVIVSVLYPVIGYLGFIILLILLHNYIKVCLQKR